MPVWEKGNSVNQLRISCARAAQPLGPGKWPAGRLGWLSTVPGVQPSDTGTGFVCWASWNGEANQCSVQSKLSQGILGILDKGHSEQVEFPMRGFVCSDLANEPLGNFKTSSLVFSQVGEIGSEREQVVLLTNISEGSSMEKDATDTNWSHKEIYVKMSVRTDMGFAGEEFSLPVRGS